MFITFACTTKPLQVQREVNGEFADSKLSLLKLIYGTWSGKITKEIKRVLLQKREIKVIKKIQNVQKIARYANLKIAKPTFRENFK